MSIIDSIIARIMNLSETQFNALLTSFSQQNEESPQTLQDQQRTSA